MKRDAGWVTASVVAVATAVSVSTIQSKPAGNSSAAMRSAGVAAGSKAQQQSSLYKGPCNELQETLSTFFSITVDLLESPDSCKTNQASPKAKKATEKEPAQISKVPAKPQPEVRFVIATLEDPLHTHASLSFDRNTEAVEQAAQDSGYTYDSSWLPWETEQSEHPLVADQDEEDSRKQRREDQPGVILFRKAIDPDPKKKVSPYMQGLVVFVVGEEATAGIHRDQFKNAVNWIAALTLNRHFKVDDIQILGPGFSGSLPSLEQLLSSAETRTVLQPDPAKPLAIYSGEVSSSLGVQWFIHATRPSSSEDRRVDFLSFQQNDDTVQQRYYGYLDGIDPGTCGLAIISEDETAYGFISPNDKSETSKEVITSSQARSVDRSSKPEIQAPKPRCNSKVPLSERQPASFYYPRDISALRNAYQEQSLFSKFGSQTSADTARHTLRDDLADPEGKQHDTIRSYGANHTALSEEAVLLQIVDMLRAHRSKFILLKCSNPLDQLFLAHFFKLTYPDARVVTLGSDLLLRREVGASGLNGIMTLSTYPLLPEIDDWTQPPGPYPNHSHRAFTSNDAEGTYIALRALLNTVTIQKGTTQEGQEDPFLPILCDKEGFPRLREYSMPFWLHNLNEPDQCHRPLTWLTVLGSNGFSPVASLGLKSPMIIEPLHPLTLRHINMAWHAVRDSLRHIVRQARNRQRRKQWPNVPLNMNIALIAVLAWSVFHAFCCCSASITVKPEHRSYFARIRHTLVRNKVVPAPSRIGHPRSHLALIVVGSILIMVVATILAWGYGWMSATDKPFKEPQLYAIFPFFIWIVAVFAIAANAYLEHYFNDPANKGIPLRKTLKSDENWQREIQRAFEAGWFSVLVFTLSTFIFFCFFLLTFDRPLIDELRTLTYFRAMNLTSGVSPVVPLIVLAFGMYGWCWYSLRGIGLFGDDKPLLPWNKDLSIKTPDGKSHALLTMLSGDKAGYRMERLCWPFHRPTCGVAGFIFALLCVLTYLIFRELPLRSLGTQRYSAFVCIWIAINISVMLANGWQLVHLWLRLQALLVFLDKLPLRRTMQAMRGFSWDSIWKIGGNVIDIRYKLFYRQFETLNHLRATLIQRPPDSDLSRLSLEKILGWVAQIQSTRPARWVFAEWYAEHWDNWTERDLATLQKVQRDVAKTAGIILTEILIPVWSGEEDSLLLMQRRNGDAEESEGKSPAIPLSHLEPYVRNAEEIVCLVYLGFIQNVLGRIRAFIMGMVCLFLSVAMVVPSYPFDPRPVLTDAVVVLFAVVAAVVFTVYSQMFRDATLSHLTNTKPGELGTEFWLKFVSFGVGPVFGLLATIFPQFSDFFFSWLQPSLSAIK
jgi:hypothetical protein